MEQVTLSDQVWFDALTLSERATALRKRTVPHRDTDGAARVAGRRLRRWRAQPPLANDFYFSQLLTSYGLTEKEFLDVLEEPAEALQDGINGSFGWTERLTRAFSHEPSFGATAVTQLFGKPAAASFLGAVEPLILSALERFENAVQTLAEENPGAPFDRRTVKQIFVEHLPVELLAMVTPTMVLELHVARLGELLEGNTAEERFQSFLKRLRQPDIALGLLREYPVLARQLIVRIDTCVDFSLELLRSLITDWNAIRATFSFKEHPGPLTELSGGAGDSHRGGRSVRILTFGSGFKLVYKPRPVSVEKHFQELLAWLNDRGMRPRFRTFNILDCGGHGWTEFIAAGECTSPEQVRCFYQRQGAYLALLYALEATDFHFENIIAAGEDPILVDLESLFHPSIGQADPEHAEQLAANKIARSVLKTGLLPQPSWIFGDSEGVDLSGLASAPGQLSPTPAPRWLAAGTDEMRLTRERVEMPAGKNRPTLNGAEVNVANYTGAVLDGFTSCYRLILQHRVDLLAEGGALTRFAADEVRVILRPTYTYGLLLRESFHPDVLRNALDRDRLFDRLWTAVQQGAHLAKLIPSERQDLENGDIPIFTTKPNSRDLWNSARDDIGTFFAESGLTLVARRIRKMSEQDCCEQSWFIRASLATLAAGDADAPVPALRATGKATAELPRLLAAACGVGDRLGAIGLEIGREASWIGRVPIGEHNWMIAPLGIDLYDGLPGVALFLAYLGLISSRERYTALAKSAVAALRYQLQRARSARALVGAFDGWGGVIYALAHLGILWQEPELLAEAESLVELLPKMIESDEQLDVISGSAGCAASLAVLYRCAPSHRTLDTAILCGERLIARAQHMECGVAWSPGAKRTRPLSGFSHGAAGIAWALLELATLTGQDRFRTVALAGIEYERSLFCADAGNWPDLRDDTVFDRIASAGNRRFATSWCHGAPGIGLARLHCLRHIDDHNIRAEIDAALKTTTTEGFGGNHCLCHGDLGNIELLLEAGVTLDDAQCRTRVERFAGMILGSIERHGWKCGNPTEVERPGLMTGLAGIGYELLRLSAPPRVPSVLALASPALGVSGGM